ncbi:hypothetical protein O9992_24630 [Vibrio lentus]|nr:hypothetical protein [Vibrio lentus]
MGKECLIHKQILVRYLRRKSDASTLSWEERLIHAKEAGFDFVEISVDETDERRARLDWSDEEIYESFAVYVKSTKCLSNQC